MERGDCPAQYRMVPSKEVSRNHQQDADALHDVEGYVPILSHWESFRAVRDVILRSVVAMYDLGRIPDHDGMGRHVEIHKRERGDEDVVTDGDIPHDTCIAPDPDPVADDGIAFPLPPKLHADGNALVQRAILPDDGFVVDGYITAMDQYKPLAYPGMPTDLDTRFPGTTPEHPSRKERMAAALVQPEPEHPSEIRFPDSRVQQSPESIPSIESIQIREYDIGDKLCHYS